MGGGVIVASSYHIKCFKSQNVCPSVALLDNDSLFPAHHTFIWVQRSSDLAIYSLQIVILEIAA